MEITDNFSITRLFATKIISIIIDKKNKINIHCKPVRAFYSDDKWNSIFHLWTMNEAQWLKLFPKIKLNYTYDYVKTIIFELGMYKEYNSIANQMVDVLKEICPTAEIIYAEKIIKIDGVTIISEIWNYIVYILKLTCGVKTTQPLNNLTPEIQAMLLKQQETEEKIKKIKAQKESDADGLSKVILSITYSFPSLTFDYLLDQTMAQIHWLQKMAAGEVSYRFNEKAYAAGNVKKGKKLDFFIK